jgi:hypothetical protein
MPPYNNNTTQDTITPFVPVKNETDETTNTTTVTELKFRHPAGTTVTTDQNSNSILLQHHHQHPTTSKPDDTTRIYPITTMPKRTRSRSAPASLTINRRNRRMVDQHYKIDKENRALLPGVPVQDVDLARDIHDFFNLIMLVPIIVLNALNWNFDKLLYNFSKHGLNGSWQGDYFDVFFYFTVFYFIVDLIWVSIIPRCVRSPSTIIQHHLVTLLYLSFPYTFRDMGWAMGVCLSVEINTWFLIARRVFNKQGFAPWKIDLPYLFSCRVKLISIGFYVTWIFSRVFLYPYLLVCYYRICKSQKYPKGIMEFAMVLHAVFCYLNAKWTYDLINSKIKQWKLKGKTKISSGL